MGHTYLSHGDRMLRKSSWKFELVAVLICVALGLVSLLSGCGGKNSDQKIAPVRGKVTYKGKPVPAGTIKFEPEGPGPSATGEIQRDGTYVLTTHKEGDGAVLGPHKVTITAPAFPIPATYADSTTSGLKTLVEDLSNELNFTLK
jgi:hypothetical protein